MNRATLTVDSGPGAGREIVVEDQVLVGREVDGPGRIEADQSVVGPEHVRIVLTHLGLEAQTLAPEWGARVVEASTGEPRPYAVMPAEVQAVQGDKLSPGDRVILGPGPIPEPEGAFALRVESVELDWMEAETGGEVLRATAEVRSEPHRYERGVLEAKDGMLTLRLREGPAFSAPISSVSASFPIYWSGVKLEVDSQTWKLNLGGATGWVYVGQPGTPGPNPDAMGEIFGPIADTAGWVSRRRARRPWKKVLRG